MGPLSGHVFGPADLISLALPWVIVAVLAAALVGSRLTIRRW